MPCYCNDINRINNDIRTLNSMLTKLESMSGNNSAQGSTLAMLSGSAGSSVTPDNIQTLTEKTRALNTRVADYRSSMSGRVKTEISNMRSRLSSLEKSDAIYHNSLAAKGK